MDISKIALEFKCLVRRIMKNRSGKKSTLPQLLNDLPDWQTLLNKIPDYDEIWSRPGDGELILIPTSVGGFTPGLVIESLLGVALKLRGANVHFLLCDGEMPACLQVHFLKIGGTQVLVENRLKEVACGGCARRGKQVLESTGLPVSYFSEFLSEEKKSDLKAFAQELSVGDILAYQAASVNLGEHAKAGALRFFSSGHLPVTEDAEVVLRRYFEAALIAHEVMTQVIKRLKPGCAVFNHGIYVPQGIIGDVARKAGVRVVNWNVGYRKKSFIFSHRETYHHTLIDEPTSTWEDIPWSSSIDKTLMQYLRSRWYGTEDWIWFHNQPQHSIVSIAEETGIDFSKPVVTALTNVFWDAQLHYKANAFKDMLDWLLQTVEYFKTRSDLQLAIRIHPAEISGSIPSRQPIEKEIRKAYPELPRNVFLISAQSQVSTYALCEHSDSAIIYGTKTGVELSAFGIPVVVAGEAWIRNKGLTMDATSPQNYFEILNTLPIGNKLSEETTLRAKKYAYHFFFRRFIPLRCVAESKCSPPFEVAIGSYRDLLPTADPGLDLICNGILRGIAFVYKAELSKKWL